MANIAANTQYKPNNLNERVTKLLSEALALYVIHKSGPDTDIEALAVSRKLLDEFSQGCAIFVGEVDYPKDAIQSSHPGYEKLIVGSRPYYNKKENMIYSEMIY